MSPLEQPPAIPEFFRSFEDLSKREQEILKAAVKDPATLNVFLHGDSWIDDHILCQGARVNGILIGFWWIGGEGIGSLTYSKDSPSAKLDVIKMLKNFMEV